MYICKENKFIIDQVNKFLESLESGLLKLMSNIIRAVHHEQSQPGVWCMYVCIYFAIKKKCLKYK